MLNQSIGSLSGSTPPQTSLYLETCSEMWKQQVEAEKQALLERRFQEVYERMHRIERLLETAYSYIEELQAK